MHEARELQFCILKPSLDFFFHLHEKRRKKIVCQTKIGKIKVRDVADGGKMPSVMVQNEQIRRM
jgi:hypothetical protein